MLAVLDCPALAAPTCTLAGVNLAFPAYDSRRVSPTDTIGQINLSCAGIAGELASFSLQLSPGTGAGFGSRSMRMGNFSLSYNLYTNPARTSIWGDGNGGSYVLSDSFTVARPGTSKSYAVYGRIPASQNVPIGTYTDLVTVTLSF